LNEGKYDFRYSEIEEDTLWQLEVKVPKFLSTNLINVDLHPEHVTIKVKDKYLQLEHPEMVLVEKSAVQRSQTTGALVIKMPKACLDEKEAQNRRVKKRKEEIDIQKKLRDMTLQEEEARQKLIKEKRQRDMRRIKDEIKQEQLITEFKEQPVLPKRDAFVPDFDPDEVPPLE